MALDRYAFCPGGTGKKIKFCCADLPAELEQIQRMLEAEQRLAGLERVRKSRAQFGDRACLLAIQCLLEDELEQVEPHNATLAVFSQKFPDNPVVLAETAITVSDAQGPQAAVVPLQRAIEASSEHFPARVFEVVCMLGRLLISRREIMSGRAHLMLELALTRGQSEVALEFLTRIGRADDIPLLLKDEFPYWPCPSELTSKSEFEAALALASRGAWLAAAEQFEALAAKIGNVASLWHNVGILRGNIADHEGAVAALRRFAALDVAPDDAIEAEALAQLLSPEDAGSMLDVVAVTWHVAEAADAQTQLGADGRATRVHFDPAVMAGSDQPPPLALYRLADRAVRESAEDITRDNVSNILGQVAVFGRQTDREARVELIATRGQELDAARAVLEEILRTPLGPLQEEEVVRQVPAIQQAMTWRWQLPADVSPAKRLELSRAQHRHVILDLWPTLPNPALGGRSPRDLATDPTSRVALAAAVFNLQLASARIGEEDTFAELRSQLGLPQPEPIDPTGLEAARIPAPRLARLRTEKLSDADLIALFRRAAWLHFPPAIKCLGEEVVQRPSLDAAPEKIDKAEAYGLLAETVVDPAERLQYIDAARQVAEKRGGSSAPWDLSELAAALESGDAESVERLVVHIESEHIREPGVAQALMSLLAQAGVIQPGMGQEGAAGMAEPALAAASQQPASPSPIWTPGGAVASPAAGGKKPTIWTPGS